MNWEVFLIFISNSLNLTLKIPKIEKFLRYPLVVESRKFIINDNSITGADYRVLGLRKVFQMFCFSDIRSKIFLTLDHVSKMTFLVKFLKNRLFNHFSNPTSKPIIKSCHSWHVTNGQNKFSIRFSERGLKITQKHYFPIPES